MIQQFLRLPHEKHAIKEASISLFFGSPFVHADAFRVVLLEQFPDEFNRVELMQGMEVHIEGQLQEIGSMAASTKKHGLPGVYAAFIENGTQTRVLQIRNDPERVGLSYHNLRYERWADFIDSFQRIAERLAPLLNNMIVLAAGLHYQDVMEWTHPSMPFPLAQLYQQNTAYLPSHFFDGSSSELLLTVPSRATELPFYDRLHITSLTENKPVATISHNVIHQFVNPTDLANLLAQPNQLKSVLQQAHEHNKSVLSGILQPEIQQLIGLTA
ncbi:TIGR04255 family protein [Hymenobacter sp. DH14]|uniref:TIGR04255 family protein n=1 Tax=Hymenobacter cyanobacteriorum TaxID=2926463 RepID=A0A9X1VGU0_9BACT|nr:TIGR04255 family protein [Hymenobacter cyanobacteriorum]MCI1187893.1 TIGR04255 family protein [Hymenobacter cyanobacteriorum]